MVKIILTAGGTGGHLFPAESLATELLKSGAEVIFVTDKRGNRFSSIADKVEVRQVKSATLKPGIVSKIKAVFDIGIGVLQAILLLKKEKPDVVVGFGGYPSFPTMFAAQLLRIKTVIHEQNGVLGKANKMLVKNVTKIACSVPNTRGAIANNNDKISVTGNPVRPAIISKRDSNYPNFDGNLNVLILGGSQGAKAFSTIIPDAFDKLSPDLQKKINIVQQARPEDLEDLKIRYAENKNLNVELQSFFDDVPERLEQAHLFIGSSGASTVSDVAVIGRPAIFIPLPLHADNQQLLNAISIKENGGARILEWQHFDADKLSAVMFDLLMDPPQLKEMAKKSHECGNPDAARKLADLTLSLVA